MSRDTLTGSRIRERRSHVGMRQSDLARQVGISASYLNLIEHNRRRIGGKLLRDIASALRVEPSILTEGAETAVIAALREAAADHAGVPVEIDRIEEFAGRFPGWAEVLSENRRRIQTLENNVAVLSDRLAHDPHLATVLHEMLSMVTAIRATASILAETRELEPEWRDRFHRNLNEDSARLTSTSQSLVRYLDSAAASGDGTDDPAEEFDAFLAAHGYRFEAIATTPKEPDQAILEQAAGQGLSAPAQRHLESWLGTARGDALALPLPRLVKALRDTGADPARLAHALGADIGVVMRRLAALPPDMAETEFGLVICDASGTLTFRKPLEGFVLPRYGAGCPLWPLFQALSRPMVPLRQVLRAATQGDRTFLAHSVALPTEPAAYGQTPTYRALMLLERIEPPEDDSAVLSVGVSCRICPRQACPARREASILGDGL